MIHIQRNNVRPWDVQVVSIGEKIAFAGVTLAGMALLETLRHLGESQGESFANGFVLDANAVDMVFDAIDAAGLLTLTMG